MTPGAVFFSEPSCVLGLPERRCILRLSGLSRRQSISAQVPLWLTPIYAHFSGDLIPVRKPEDCQRAIEHRQLRRSILMIRGISWTVNKK